MEINGLIWPISNSSKLSCMSSLPVSMKRIPSRTTEKKWQIITLYVAMETSDRIWPNFELSQAFMHVLIACKYEKDQMINSGENVMTHSSSSVWSKYECFLTTGCQDIHFLKNLTKFDGNDNGNAHACGDYNSFMQSS